MTEYWAVRHSNAEPVLAWIDNSQAQAGIPKSLCYWSVSGRRSRQQTTKDAVPDAVQERAAELTTPGYQPVYTITRYPIQPGKFHPRIARNSQAPTQGFSEKARLSADTDARILFEMLEEIFSTLEPDPKIENAYGHRLRHFLILACTEIEAAWVGVLRANGFKGKRPSTKEYVKLLGPMRLDEWKVRLAIYPDYPEVTPFAGWDPKKPTESLKWYDAYNKVKHNREINLSMAHLGHVISAAAALYIMEMAQFGTQTRGKEVFRTMTIPKWQPEELYFPPLSDSDTWSPVNYGF